jgi:cytochrome P450
MTALSEKPEIQLETRMPPGPRMPRALQTAGFMLGGPRFLDACRRRYGDAVTFGTLFDSQFVMVFHPALVKQVFQGSGNQLRAGEANAMLGPIVGERSVLLLDGSEHLRHRRLLLPPFHGQRMHAYADVMRESADLEIDSWPVSEPFPLLPSMQSLTLRVIMRAVFGFEPGPAEQELRDRLRAMIEPMARPRGLMLMYLLTRRGGDRAAAGRFEASRRAVDEILFDEIARRRDDPELESRDDVFSALLLAQDEDGSRLSDAEVRDELVTLLLAGHETTATGLAWAFDLLLHSPAMHKRASEGDSELVLDGYVIPPGVEINPSIRMIHRRADLYPDPGAFRPERFLGPDAPDTYTWIPFGGGTRRCLGASFAQVEMRVVLRRVLERCALRPGDPKPAEIQFRGITQAPRNGALAIQDRAPRAGSDQ